MSSSPQAATVAAQGSEPMHAYVFAADGSAQALDAQAALDWLAQADDGRAGFIWLHFANPHNIGNPWLEQLRLPQAFRDVLREERRSSRLAHSDHTLFAVINDVSYDLSRRIEPEVATLWLGIRQRWFLSAWSAPLRPLERLVARVEAGQPLRNPLALLIPLLAEQAGVLMDVVRHAAERANGVESMLATDRLPKRAHLGGIRRDLVRLQRLLSPEPASLLRLVNRLPGWAQEQDRDALHLATENFAVALRDMAGLQERVKLLEEEIAARVAERTDRGVFVLTSATVVALPVTILATLFGMNVGGLPLRESADGFALILGASLSATALAVWLVMRLLRA